MVTDINYKAAWEAADEIKSAATNPGFRVEVAEVDVTVEQSVRQSMARAMELFGRIDHCVNCAGVSSSLSLCLNIPSNSRGHPLPM